MVAFIRPPEKPRRSPRLRHAHRLLADALLTSESGRSDAVPPVAAWKAWLLAGGLTVAAIWAIGHALGILP